MVGLVWSARLRDIRLLKFFFFFFFLLLLFFFFLLLFFFFFFLFVCGYTILEG